MRMHGIIALLLLSAFNSSAHAQIILESSTTWEGGAIVYPRGKPKITSVILKVREGEVTDFHCHPVPTLGYILQGSLEVETKTGKKATFNEGDAVVEVLGTVHRATAIGGPAEAVVFYVGENSIPNTILVENDPEFTHCDP
jgi:quercetin dioxygenase-like cupin family protein